MLPGLLSFAYYQYYYVETLRLTVMPMQWQTDNVRHFVRYKNKIIDRKMFYLDNLFKRPLTTYCTETLCSTKET